MSEVIEAPVAAPVSTETTTDTTTETTLEPQETTEQTEVTTAKPEPTPAEKEAARLRRRVDRLTAEKYRTAAEIEQLRKQPQPQAGEEEAPQNDPRQMQAEITRAARAQVDAERFNAKCNDVYEQGTKATPKFGELFRAVSEEVGGLITDKGPTPLMNALLDSDVPTHKLIQHLAANPDVAAELADLSPLRQAKRLALIEQDIKAPKTPQPSNAPKPVKPVGASSTADSPDPKDTKAWIAWRNTRKK